MKKLLTHTILPCALTIVIVCAVFFATRGIPLFGAPKPETISRVEVTDLRLGGETRTFTDPEKIELARNLLNFLNYRINGEPEGTPVVTVTYYVDGADPVSVSANGTTVWWNKKARAVKEQEIFLTLTEGIFFNDLVSGQR